MMVWGSSTAQKRNTHTHTNTFPLGWLCGASDRIGHRRREYDALCRTDSPGVHIHTWLITGTRTHARSRAPHTHEICLIKIGCLFFYFDCIKHVIAAPGDEQRNRTTKHTHNTHVCCTHDGQYVYADTVRLCIRS